MKSLSSQNVRASSPTSTKRPHMQIERLPSKIEDDFNLKLPKMSQHQSLMRVDEGDVSTRYGSQLRDQSTTSGLSSAASRRLLNKGSNSTSVDFDDYCFSPTQKKESSVEVICEESPTRKAPVKRMTSIEVDCIFKKLDALRASYADLASKSEKVSKQAS